MKPFEEIDRMIMAALKRNSSLVGHLESLGYEYEDILQDVRVHVWRKLDRYSANYAPSTFIYVLVQRKLLHLITYYSRERRHTEMERLPITVMNPDDGSEDEWIADPCSVEDEVVIRDVVDHLVRRLADRFPHLDGRSIVESLMDFSCDLSGNARRAVIQVLRQAILEYDGEVYR